MIKRQIICMFTMVTLLLCGCTTTRPTFSSELTEPDANLTLYVSNQSFAEPRTDIVVFIDSRTLFQDEFEVKNQHYWKVYSIHLPPGNHTLYAKAVNGNLAIKRSFAVSGKHWAVLNFWRSDNNTNTSKHEGLTFNIYDKPIWFM